MRGYAKPRDRIRRWLAHLGQRMRQSGDWTGIQAFQPEDLRGHLARTIDQLDIRQARLEVEPFVRDPAALAIWSHAFFQGLVDRLQPV